MLKTVIYRLLTARDLMAASCQITKSYQAAYCGLMDDSYLTSLSEEH